MDTTSTASRAIPTVVEKTTIIKCKSRCIQKKTMHIRNFVMGCRPPVLQQLYVCNWCGFKEWVDVEEVRTD